MVVREEPSCHTSGFCGGSRGRCCEATCDGYWLDHYEFLFKEVDSIVKNKDKVKAEVIFLTHNENKHQHNLLYKTKGEHLIWNPNIQEAKISQYGGTNIRYRYDLKAQYIKEWLDLHNSIIPWNEVRYIF